MKMFRNALILAVLALSAVACSKNVKPTDAGAAAPAAATTVAPAPTTVNTAPQVSPLDDPNSPLAQRIVYFDFDKSDVKPEYLDTLTAHAKYLVANPSQKIRIEGYTDERGTVEYNIALGDRRAQAVRRFMLFQGVSADQITTVSYGEAHPSDSGHDETSWSKNRRAVIVYLR
ncbi:MAG TPA: peptidoglycan-associated lipoprotein Pal [Gammaproteobacteria bacterium]|jgi:peptidoglycan-associated lipoprotein|nr:peptidoglycan-associated lipoprotein Pal [Gammaproteobacteria bacterium]